MIRHVSKVIAGVFAAVPDVVLGAMFLITWVQPDRLGDGMTQYLFLVLMLEFIVIHSAGFMSHAATSITSPWRKAGAILGLGAVYSILAGAFSMAYESSWLLFAFWGLTLNRLLRAIVGGAFTHEETELVKKEWVSTAGFYMLFLFATLWLPLPRLGVEPVLPLPGEDQQTGAWSREPWRLLAFGFLYFSTIGLKALFTVKLAREHDGNYAERMSLFR